MDVVITWGLTGNDLKWHSFTKTVKMKHPPLVGDEVKTGRLAWTVHLRAWDADFETLRVHLVPWEQDPGEAEDLYVPPATIDEQVAELLEAGFEHAARPLLPQL